MKAFDLCGIPFDFSSGALACDPSPATASLADRHAAEKAAGRYAIITATHTAEELHDTRKGTIAVDVKLIITGHHYPGLPEEDSIEVLSVKADGDACLVDEDGHETTFYSDGDDYLLGRNPADSRERAMEILAEAIKCARP